MFRRIDKQKAQELLKENNALLVDIRDTQSYNDSHLESAIHLTQENINKFIDETSKETPILVICYHGNSSQSVAQYLSSHSFTNVYSIDGGYEGWINE